MAPITKSERVPKPMQATFDAIVDSAGEPSQAPYGNHPGTQPRTLGV